MSFETKRQELGLHKIVILNTTDLDPIEGMEESLGHNSSPTTSILLSSAPSSLLTPTMASGSNSGEGGSGNWAKLPGTGLASNSQIVCCDAESSSGFDSDMLNRDCGKCGIKI